MVASRSQREHVQARLVQHLGGAAIGVSVKTLYQAALDIGTAEDAPGAEFLFDALLERAWRTRSSLRQALDPFDDAA